MFSSLGLFTSVKCPQLDCNLPVCLFSHDSTGEGNRDVTSVYDPEDAGSNSLPCTKRRRLNSQTLDNETEIASTSNDSSVPLLSTGKDYSANAQKQAVSSRGPIIPAARHNGPVLSAERAVSPPPKKRKVRQEGASLPTKSELKQEQLIPRTTTKDPVAFPQRMSILQKFHKQIVDKNAEVIKLGSSYAHLVLSEQEMVRQALDDEQKSAQTTSSPDGYKNALAARLSYFRKMTMETWKQFVLSTWRQPPDDAEENEKQDNVITGLTEKQEIALVRLLKTSLDGLNAHGYVLEPPSTHEVAQATLNHVVADGWELCERCGTRFQVFPGRNEDGLLTTRGSCTYHWARVQRRKGQIEAVHPCCSKSAGSEGCCVADSHCFKVSDAKRLASLLQFERTPSSTEKNQPTPVAFDCEMAYTTYGLELIRLTAVSWPKKGKLLDVLVRPFGELLDLNTRFSGVTVEQYTNAPMLNSRTIPSGDELKEGQETGTDVLYKAESPAIARRLLFDLITPDTPLIGHAIDNDLNACRIIHPFIIDTVLLFPHPKGLPVRYKLKDLSHKYLQRQIQTGGEEGHDSLEDSLATGDLVLVRVREKWKQMKLAGFKWDDNNRIVSPS